MHESRHILADMLYGLLNYGHVPEHTRHMRACATGIETGASRQTHAATADKVCAAQLINTRNDLNTQRTIRVHKHA